MKKPFIFLFALSLTAASAHAQATPPPTPAVQAAVASQVSRMTQELGLSAEQQTRLRQVLLLTRQHMDADRTAHQGDPAALKTAMAFDRAKSEELIQGVLTPAQYVKYQQYKAARIGQLHTTAH